jgi:hypothetical protein
MGFHADIRDQQVEGGGKAGMDVKGLAAVAGPEHRVSVAFQYIGHQLPDGIFVIDHENGPLPVSGIRLGAGGQLVCLVQEGFLQIKPKLA